MNRRLLIVAALTIPYAGAATTAVTATGPDGETKELPKLVVTAKKQSMRTPATPTGTGVKADLSEVPQSVEVIPQAMLEERDTSSFYEAMQYESGMSTGGNSSFTASSGRPTMRGFNGSDVMLDGLALPARMPIFMDSAGMAGIEFYKGPVNGLLGGQSGLQGGGGSVNILAKTANFDETKQQLWLGFTGGNGGSERFSYDPNFIVMDGLAVRVPFAISNEEPYYLPDNLDSGFNFNIAPSLAWKIAPTTTATVTTSFQKSDKAAYQGIPYLKGNFLVPLDTYYGDNSTRDEYEGLTLQAKVEHAFTERLKLTIGAGYAHADEDRSHWSAASAAAGMTSAAFYNKMIATGTAPFSFTAGKYEDQNTGAFSRLSYDFDLGPTKHQTVAGLDYLVRENDMFSVAPGGTATTGWQSLTNPVLPTPVANFGAVPSHTESSRTGIAVQDFITWDKWRFLLGGRYDFHDREQTATAKGQSAEAFSPRIGVTYMLQPQTSLFANFTQATGPNFDLKDAAGDYLTNSWENNQIEAGVKHRIAGDLWGTVSLFRIDQENTPELIPGTLDRYVADGENRSWGAEMSLSGELTDNWSWWGSYTWLKYKDVDDNIDFTRFPEHSFSLWTSYRFTEGPAKDLRCSLGYRFRDEWLTTFRGAYIGDEWVIESSNVFDLAFEYPLKWASGEGVSTKLEAGIKNIFGEEYVESNRHGSENFAGLPRTFWVRLSATF